MPRRSIPSTTLLAQVRRYFGLEQQELAAYLGISRQLLAHIEAGRRTLTGKLLLRLAPLAALLPAEAPARPALPAPEEAPPAQPATGPLEARLDACRHQAGKLRRELQRLAADHARARRWQVVLPGLLATADAGSPAHAWLLVRQNRSHATLHDPHEAACYHLLRLRAEALETEAAGLAALLAAAVADAPMPPEKI